MKRVNLSSIVQAYDSLDEDLFNNYLGHFGLQLHSKSGSGGIKKHEPEGLKSLVSKILEQQNDISIVNDYFIGYTIPQISAEFDLLRFGNNYIINIEIKQKSTEGEIQKQLERNRYYLKFLGKQTHHYSYILEDNKLYKLLRNSNGNTLKEVDFVELCEKLLEQEINDINDIDSSFDPSNYLVSPFNATEKFMEGGYFLTGHQEEICKEVQKQLNDKMTNFIAITGGAGTGKTLLTYHIAKEMISDGGKVLILHCAKLNHGQKTLNQKWEWEICIPNHLPENIDIYDLIIVDEAQRIYPSQFKRLVDRIKSKNKKCIFSYDKKQYLMNYEQECNMTSKIEDELLPKLHKLTDKIRTNKEIAYFIKQLFDDKKNITNQSYPNVELIYCSSGPIAKTILLDLSKKGWTVPNYTPGKTVDYHYEEYKINFVDSAHGVIGQEFDNIAAAIDTHFKYSPEGKLVANNRYYSQVQMLYQILTRTRKKLCIVVVDNEEMLERCLKILN